MIDEATARGTYRAMIDVCALLLAVGDRGRPGVGDPEELKHHSAAVDCALAVVRAHCYREGLVADEDDRLSLAEARWAVDDLPEEVIATLREAAGLDPELPPVARPGPTAGDPVV